MTHSYKIFLARWARRLSWNEVATVFETSWGCVFRAVKAVVDYGLAHRSLDGVTQIGVDEIAVFRGQKYLTMVYQLDAGFRRLLWCGPERRVKTLLRFFRMFGKELSAKLKYVCSDMWGPYLKAKLAMRRSYGFKSIENLQIALYHTLGSLPDPPGGPHIFC